MQGVSSLASGLSGAASSIAGLFGAGGSTGNPFASNWRSKLRPASFGGVPFGVLDGYIRVGRRNAVHEYPFKDDVWVEDLGRSARRISLHGFLLENAAYGGGDVIDQRERLIAVCESADQKTLVHPTLGTLTVSLLDASMSERWDQGRVFEISFSFIEAGVRVFPSAEVATESVVQSGADALDAAASSDFGSMAQRALANGASVVDMAVSTTSMWCGTAGTLAKDATNLMSCVGSLQGSYGRYFGGRTIGFGSLIGKTSAAGTTVSQLIATGTQARAGVSQAVATLQGAASAIGL